MDEPAAKRRSRVGGGLIAILAIAAILGLGMWCGQRQEASLEPCERYARAVHTALDNCHSGVNRDRVYHREHCERAIDVTAACLKEIEELSLLQCRELERRVSSHQLCRE